ITFSERSLPLRYNSSRLFASSELSPAFLFSVPLIGWDRTLLPSFFRNLSGLAQISHLSSSLYRAENGLGEIAVSFLYTATGSITVLSAKNSWQKLIS